MSYERKTVDFPRDAEKIKDAFQDKTAFYLLPDLRDPTIELDVLEYAGDKGELLSQVFARDEAERKKIGRAHKKQAQKLYRYKIRLSGTKNPQANPQAIPRVFAEGNLPKEQLAEVAGVHKLIGKFRETAPIYVFGEGDEDPYWKVAEPSEQYDPLHNRTTLFVREFLHPDVPRQAEQIACHESCHSLMRNSKLEGPELEATQALRATFSRLAKEVDPNMDDIADSPVFSIFREFSYYPRKADKKITIPAGHPWSNSDELFASAVTVFRYYPSEFSIRFKKLSEELRPVVIDAANNVLNLLEVMNPDPQALKELIPAIDTIRKTLS